MKTSFSLSGVDPNLFCQFQWGIPGQPLSFLVYRLIFALYQIGWNIAIIAVWGDPRFYRPVDSKAKWPIYASNWALFLFSCYSIQALITSICLGNRRKEVQATDVTTIELNLSNGCDRVKKPSESHQTAPSVPWFVKMTWLLQVTSYSATLFVSIAFWAIDFNPALEPANIFSVHTHACTSVMVLIDIFLVAIPTSLGHLVYCVGFSICYFTFTFVYFILGGLNPYGETFLYAHIVDWKDSALISFLAATLMSILVAPLMHLSLFGLFKLRTFVHGKLTVPSTIEVS